MAKLPGIADLGPAERADPTRPVASYDISPLARGGQAIAQGYEKLGAGIAQAASGMGEMAQDQSRWQFSQARADFITSKIDLDAQYGQDKNYGPDASGKTLPQRYQDAITAQQNKSAALIQDPNMRGLFVTHTKSTLEEGVVQAQSHARALGNDAAIAYVDKTGTKIMDQAVTAPDDATRTQLIDSHNQLVDGLVGSGAVTQVQAVQMKQAWAHQYATADILARADSDPQGVVNELRAAPGSPEAITGRIIQIEGKGKNGKSSANGTGQFVDSTWLDVLKRNRPDLAQGRSDTDLLALKADDNLGREMTANYQRENTAALKAQGIEASPGNIYLAHFLGAGGAAAVLKADPNMPVQDALAKVVGPNKAAAMVAANPSVLQGKLAGSVKEWSDGLMGGGSRLVDMIRPDVREQLLAHAQTQLQKQTVQDLTGFKARIEDTQAEAQRTGNVTKPMSLGEFVAPLGAEAGPKAYQAYQAGIQVARDVTRVSTMDPGQMQDLVASYAPKPGTDGYAAAAERQDLVRQAVAKSLKERGDDPAGFAVARLPGTQEAYKSYSTVAANPVSSAGERAVAARSFAATTMLEQQGAGIPLNQRQILPAADVEHFKTAMANAATSDDPKARTGLIGQVQAQKEMWGDYWPDVVRQLAPTMQPVVKAIAAGADTTAMTRLLSLDPKENPAQLLKEQSETRSSDVRKALNTEMAPLLASMVGRQKDHDFVDYYNMGDKLAALYVRDGMDASGAASKAFKDLIGNRYDFRDTYRIPKDSGVAPDDVQAGALAAKNMIGAVPPIRDSLAQATSDLGLTPQEQALYQRHLTNLTGAGGVDNADGSRSTLYQAVQEHDGRFYNIPTVWNGKIETEKYTNKQGRTFDVPNQTALANVEREGWNKFPSYAGADEADARYDKMHGYMERDTEQLLNGRKSNPLNVKPAIDDIGGLSDAAGDSLSKFRRDVVWVTAPRNDGLNLMYGDKAVRNTRGEPLFLSWGQLAQLGGSPEARAKALSGALSEAPQLQQ